MSDDERISSYVRSVRSALRLPREQRRRVVEEIRNHLDDGTATHMRHGATREQAIGLAISELGQPDTVAAEFNENRAHGSVSTGALRWLPLVLPLLLFGVRVGFLAWSVVWIADGWTVGERTAQKAYLLGAVATGALSFGAYFSIDRAQSDPAWRWGAWMCMSLGLFVIVVGRV